jgi:hypothetical protein
MIRNTRMQNLFRVQPSTGVSKNFIIQTYFYVEALEPDLKAAVSAGLHDKDAGETVEICIRAFRMLVVTLEVSKLLSVNRKKCYYGHHASMSIVYV